MSTPATPEPGFQPGFVVLHGNRLETLAEAAITWLARHPLGPLEEERLLVPSNGMGEWLKHRIAQQLGVAAGLTVELPGRFAWSAWRALLGREAVPAASPLDKTALAWRLLRLLPTLAAADGFEPLQAYLQADRSPPRVWPLAQQLADLFDQYQVYRADWIDDWAAGHDHLRRADGAPADPLPTAQAWQARLWRALLDDIAASPDNPGEAPPSRPALHRRFVQTLQRWPAGQPLPAGLPRRLLLFGTTQLPHTLLLELAALARHIPVLLAVPNPSPLDWAGAGAATSHPLLAAWGRQARDFVRQLDEHDERETARERLGLPAVPLFSTDTGPSLLQTLQAHLRDLTPLPAATDPLPWNPSDRSLVFHSASGPMREVEVLHDQLLSLMAERGIAPREVVVMVPDIEVFAPAVAAVFGQHAAGTARHIPWGLADRRQRQRQPLLVAVETLLGLRQRRLAYSELRDLLDVGAVAARLGWDADTVARVARWVREAGVRWGLDARQRADLGLGAAGEVGSWRFGLQRLLMGYATGQPASDAGAPGGIEPQPGVAGLDAAELGVLATWLDRLGNWWQAAAAEHPPATWVPTLTAWLDDHFVAVDAHDEQVLAALRRWLADWRSDCAAARFEQPLPLAVVREAWLDGVDAALGANSRFRAGGVTFCTLLPLRAIPFRVVCLLGMNDGTYPRPSPRNQFDLLADTSFARSGDRSRRDDDRQLMLDALLAARELLYISHSGHRARDRQAQQPSVLVAQLRDHVAAVWGRETLQSLSTEHPMQPFARRLFEGTDAQVYTHANEWRVLHDPAAAVAAPVFTSAAMAGPIAAPIAAPTAPESLTLAELAAFVARPVRAWFRERLSVHWQEHSDDSAAADDEAFALDGLLGWQLLDTVVAPWADGRAWRPAPDADSAAWAAPVHRAVARLARAGRLPWAGPGRWQADTLAARARPMLKAQAAALQAHARHLEPLHIGVSIGATWLDAGEQRLVLAADAAATPQRITLAAGRVLLKNKAPRLDKLLPGWLLGQCLAAAGRPTAVWRIGEDAIVQWPAADTGRAKALLADLLAARSEALAADTPWPVAVRTSLLALQALQADEAADLGAVFESECHETELARAFPRLEDLLADGRFEALSQRLYGPLLEDAERLTVLPLPEADLSRVPEDDTDSVERADA